MKVKGIMCQKGKFSASLSYQCQQNEKCGEKKSSKRSYTSQDNFFIFGSQ
jgi:hypothetical protein